MPTRLPRVGSWVRAAIRAGARPGSARRAALVGLCVLAATGCSREKKAVSDIRDAFDAGEFRDAVALCRHAIRNGVVVPDVYFYYGASLVSLDRDFEGFRQFDRAAAADPNLSPRVAQFLFERGRESFEKRLRSQAARRIRKALEIDPALDIGPFLYLVADSYFADKDYERSAQTYARALANDPDTTAAEEAFFNMAVSYEETGSPSRARDSLERMLDLYPDGRLATEARWRLVNLMYDEGEKDFVLGNYEEAVAVLNDLLGRTRNPGMRQKSRFLLGETYERMGEFDEAYRQYEKIIESDRGASGRIVDRARDKMAALREAGLF